MPLICIKDATNDSNKASVKQLQNGAILEHLPLIKKAKSDLALIE